MNINKDELHAKMSEYLSTVDDSQNNEWWCTTKDIHQEGINGFFKWMFGDEAKEQRRQQYEKLRIEFELEENNKFNKYDRSNWR